MATKKKKENWIVKLLKIVVAIYLLLVLCQLIGDAYSRLSVTHKITVSEGWNLIIVNRWNELPEDYSVELTELSNGQKVDSRIYPYLQEMFDAAKENGVYLMEAFAYQHSPYLTAIEEEIAKGVIGDIRYMEAALITSDYVKDDITIVVSKICE